MNASDSTLCLRQILAASEALAVYPFKIGNKDFLAVANNINAGTQCVSTRSVIYKMTGRFFVVSDEIPTTGAKDVTSFTHRDQLYLIFSEWRNSIPTWQATFASKIVVYRYSKRTNKFQWYQEFCVEKASNADVFTVKQRVYLAVVSERNGLSLFWFRPGIGFASLYSMPIPGLTNVNHFIIDHEIYLALSVDAYNWSGLLYSRLKMHSRIFKISLTGEFIFEVLAEVQIFLNDMYKSPSTRCD